MSRPNRELPREASVPFNLNGDYMRFSTDLHTNVKNLAKQCHVSFSQMANILMTIGFNQINPMINPDEDSILASYTSFKNKYPELFNN